MLARDNAVMQEANTTLGSFYTNNEERRKYEAAERYILDRNTLFYSGMQEGISQGKFEIARNMKFAGMSDSEIIKFTGLTLQEIKKL